MRSWLATWGMRAAAAPTRRLVDERCAIGPGRRCPRRCRRGWRARDGAAGGLAAQIAELETQQQAAVTTAAPTSAVRQLVQLKGVATTSASVLLDEGLVWRAFRNRRQIGGLLGFAPTPYDSGESERDQGISRRGQWPAAVDQYSAGVELGALAAGQRADAVVSARALATGKRARRIGIVAVARKLVIALWRYVTTGVVPRARAESRVG